MIGLILILSSDTILFVGNFFPTTSPTNSMLWKVFFWENKGLNPVRKHWLIFNKINNIEPDFMMFFQTMNFEVEPLVMTFCVDIILKNQIVGLDVDLSCGLSAIGIE